MSLKFFYILLIIVFVPTKYSVSSVQTYRFKQGSCPDSYVMCETGYLISRLGGGSGVRCIKINWICDNKTECVDGSDEKYCPYNFAEDDCSPDLPSDFIRIGSSCNSNSSKLPRTLSDLPRVEQRNFESSREITIFSIRVGIKMNKLNSHTYLLAERLINKVLFEAQMGNLTYLTDIIFKNS